MKLSKMLCPLLSMLILSSCSLSEPIKEQTSVTTKATTKKEIVFTSEITEKTTISETTSPSPEESEGKPPVFSELEPLVAYMRDEYKKGVTEIAVGLSDGFKPLLKELVYYVNLPLLNAENHHYSEEYTEVVYTTELYPGMKIAAAYHSGDTSKLNEEETVVYKIAAEIVEKAKTMPSDIAAERFIHDEICRATAYFDKIEKESLSRYCTAVGVFIDGKANCQGYADAFCMLSEMYGFNADKLTGIAAGIDHVWNIIELDGEWYSVDVCWDDNIFAFEEREYIQYYYFNAPTELMRGDHVWNDMAAAYPLKKELDENYFYLVSGADETSFGHNTESLSEAVWYCADRLIAEKTESFVMAPYDGAFDTADEVCAEINRYITEKKITRHITYNAYVKTIGDYTFLYVELT